MAADRRCSPGVSATSRRHEVCVPGYATAHRNVSQIVKESVYDAYGIAQRAPYGQAGSFEIDHIVPLELGGSNDIRNLFPEPFPDYIAKDHMENFMHDQVCYHGLSLKSAQRFFERKYAR